MTRLFLAPLERHPLVDRYRDAGTGDRRIRVTLAKGYAFGRHGPHWTIASTPEAALEHLRWAEPCSCDRCVA